MKIYNRINSILFFLKWKISRWHFYAFVKLFEARESIFHHQKKSLRLTLNVSLSLQPTHTSKSLFFFSHEINLFWSDEWRLFCTWMSWSNKIIIIYHFYFACVRSLTWTPFEKWFLHSPYRHDTFFFFK